MIDRQIVDDYQSQVMIILRVEYGNIFQIDDLLSEIVQRRFRKRIPMGLVYLVAPTKFSILLEKIQLYTDPQYRFDHIKSHLEDYEKASMEVIEERMHKLFERIENTCNNAGTT